MIPFVYKAGGADRSVVVRVVDEADGTPETGVAYNTSGIDLKYWKVGANAAVDITEATQTVNGAHSDGGFVHVGAGYCRLDLPDAATSTAGKTIVFGTITGMIVIGAVIDCVAYDPTDTVRLGLTALPNAAADAAGGLPISDAGGLDIDALNTNVSAILSDTGTDGVVVAAASKTGYSLTATTGLGNQTANITGNLSGSVGSVTASVNVGQIAGQTANASGAVTFPATIASTTNITAGTITTVSGNVTGSVGSLATQAKADVNAEVLDVLNTDTFAEPGQEAPGATVSLVKKISYLYKAWRNKSEQTSSQYSLYADDASTVDQKSAVTDNGTTLTRGEVATGP
jgi:hypothetical protein